MKYLKRYKDVDFLIENEVIDKTPLVNSKSRVVTRYDLFNIYKKEYPYLPVSHLSLVFNSLSDQQLADTFRLKLLRKGYFYSY